MIVKTVYSVSSASGGSKGGGSGPRVSGGRGNGI